MTVGVLFAVGSAVAAGGATVPTHTVQMTGGQEVPKGSPTGKGTFPSPQPIRALTRIYNNYTQVVARAGTGIASVADMKGKRVSTGSPNSGTEVIALRLLTAAGLDPAKDIQKQSLGLPETVQAMKDGTIDALIWSGGLPTAGITDLVTSLKDRVVFIGLDVLLSPLREKYGQVYQGVTIPKDAYKIATAEVPTLKYVSR